MQWWHKDRHTDNGIAESPETSPHIYGHNYFHRGSQEHSTGKKSFPQIVLDKMDIYGQKKKIGLLLGQ